jgi:hypothetical protein
MHTETQSELISRDERRAFEAAWRAYVAAGTANAPAYLLQAIIRGRDPKRGFTPVSNQLKLANGQWAWQGYEGALFSLRYNPAHHLQVIWPQMQSVEVARFEALVAALSARLDLLKKEARA